MFTFNSKLTRNFKYIQQWNNMMNPYLSITSGHIFNIWPILFLLYSHLLFPAYSSPYCFKLNHGYHFILHIKDSIYTAMKDKVFFNDQSTTEKKILWTYLFNSFIVGLFKSWCRQGWSMHLFYLVYSLYLKSAIFNLFHLMVHIN